MIISALTLFCHLYFSCYLAKHQEESEQLQQDNDNIAQQNVPNIIHESPNYNYDDQPYSDSNILSGKNDLLETNFDPLAEKGTQLNHMAVVLNSKDDVMNSNDDVIHRKEEVRSKNTACTSDYKIYGLKPVLFRGWKIYSLWNASRLYARHAYLDTRSNNHDVWHVRIYAVVLGDADIYGRGQLFCVYQSYTNATITSIEAIVYDKRMKEIQVNGKIAHRVFISCRITRDANVQSVYVTSHIPCSIPERAVPLEVKMVHVNSSPPTDIGICMPLSYGTFTDIDAVRLIEWIELHKILGVQEINIYNVTMTVSALYRTVLNHYVADKVVRLHNIPPPVESRITAENIYNISKISDLIVLNECMMENMFRYRYIIVIDFDEVIVPRSDTKQKYRELIDNLRVYGWLSQTFVSYLVPQVYFYLDVSGYRSKPEYLAMIKHAVRIGNGHDLASPKQITNPRRCALLYMHYCDQIYTRDDAFQPAYNLGYVSSEQFLVHHYRKSCGAKWRPGAKGEEWTVRQRCKSVRSLLSSNAKKQQHVDRQLWQYETRLKTNVEAVFDSLDLWDKVEKAVKSVGKPVLRTRL